LIVGGIVYWGYTHKEDFVKTAPPIIEEAAPPTSAPEEDKPIVEEPDETAVVFEQNNANAIKRTITLKTRIPEDRPNYNIRQYTVSRGDSTFSIADEYNIEPETLLWANYNTLEDDPHALRVGQELNIPPINGIY
jgi:hypothetical protein